MKTLPENLSREAHKLHAGSSWLVLLDIEVSATQHLRLVNNTEDVVFEGNTYVAFAFEFPGIPEDVRGSVTGIDIRVSNVTKVIQTYLEAYQGGAGFPVTVYLVNSEHLAEDYAELTWKFSIIKTLYDEQWVTFRLGAPNLLRRQFPPDRYIADRCRWAYGGYECTHAGNPCNYTLSSCRQRGNSHRWGGFPGLSRIGLRLVE